MSFLSSFFGQIIYFIDSIVHNYGITIIIFTILTKLLLLPLNLKSTKSMRETQKLADVTAYFQKKYKNNPEKLNQVTMQLYQVYHVNPLGGCLPLLIQLPIIYGLFGALRNPTQFIFTHGDASVASQPFLWLPNLSNPDPYYIIPILCVVFTFLTSKYTNSVTPQTGDEQSRSTQNIMLYMMPLMIGFFALSLPSGVGIYWVVQNIFTFIQQFFILHKPVEPITVEEAEKELEKYNKEKREEIRVTREMGTTRRNEMMGIENEPKKKKKKTSSVKMTPASGKKVTRKTITKIPQRKD